MRPVRFCQVIVIAFVSLVLSACTVSTSLVPVMPEEADTFGFTGSVSQPFYSEDDGLYKLSVRFYPEGFPGSQLPIDPSRGAMISVTYSPRHDPRFPEPAFSDWPEHHEWLPELTGDNSYAQSFCSPYPALSGIRLRVATFRGDTTPGIGVLRPFDTAVVRSLPVVGQQVALLPGGIQVQVLGSAEGWAHVTFGDDRTGFVSFDDFIELPPPGRINDQDVTLVLYDAETGDAIRRVDINADDMFDNSHQTFEFEPLEDSTGACYLFELTSPESVPGNAITMRYDSSSDYVEGTAILNGTVVDGDLVFEPVYGEQQPLYRGALDDYEWAAPLDAFEVRFDPVSGTADRYLIVEIRSGERPVNVPWSTNRPPGLLPLEASNVEDAPRGGLIFNAAFRSNVPLAETSRVAARDLYSRARQDKPFYAFMALLLGTVAIAGLVAFRRSSTDGR